MMLFFTRFVFFPIYFLPGSSPLRDDILFCADYFTLNLFIARSAPSVM